MMRAVLIVLCLSSAFLLCTCAGDSCVNGSECDLIDCAYDSIVCDFYPQMGATPRTIVIHYRRTLDAGLEWMARVTVEFPGTGKIAGTLIKDQAFLDQVTIERPGSVEQWPNVTSGSCQVDSGGDDIGKPMSGKCSFHFDNGRGMTACFSCTLQNAS